MDSDTIWIYYKDRPVWKDVTPIPQCEEDLKIVNIDYSEKCISQLYIFHMNYMQIYRFVPILLLSLVANNIR